MGVLKSKNDLRILLKDLWYRIPVAHLPRKKFKYIAFYQPAVFGRKGKRIEYYARVSSTKIVKRILLLPKEQSHPRAQDDYLKVEFKEIKKLPQAIKNIIPRRISFGFTDLKTLLAAQDILELYRVPPTEQIVERELNRLGIETKREFNISKDGKRYRLDLAVFCENSRIAIECDNDKAHSSGVQIEKDKIKDAFLRRRGWRVIRLKEKDILENLDRSISSIRRLIPR